MILKDTLRQLALSQRQELVRSTADIQRTLLPRIDLKSRHVVILTGIRRCGKSTLLRQIMRQLPFSYFFDFEDPRAARFELSDFERLEDVFRATGSSRYYFFDEIQNVPQWERYVRKLQDAGNKVFLTGSNASLLSQELGAKLTGRHLSYVLFPFSYSEMLQYTHLDNDSASFERYIEKGGFPEHLAFDNVNILMQLFHDIIARDIIARLGIRDSRTLTELAVFLLSNSGNEFSYTRLKNQFNLGSTNTAISYVQSLENSYLLRTVPKFDFSYSRQRQHSRKAYAVDTGLVRANSASFSPDKGRLLENLVFLHLSRYSTLIYYFKNKHECDFLVRMQDRKKLAVQVCYELNEENLPREKMGLLEAMQASKATQGLILTLNQDDQVDGIPVRSVRQWCLEELNL